MKYLKRINESLRPSDYTIFKIRYYADGINVRKGQFDGDDKQHWDRAQEYTKFFWQMVEKVTNKPHSEWIKDYFLSTNECVREELHEKYDIIIPESEEYYYWYIPNTMTELISWINENCKLPFQIVKRSPYNSILNREKTTWRRSNAKEFVVKNFNKFNESVSIFDSNWTKYLPDELSIITNNGQFTLKLKRDKSLGHNVDISNLMNNIQIAYYQNTAEDGDVLKDGEPDYLCFDIDLVKNNKGDSANPDTLKMNIDITYGDNMASEFSIEKPNKVNITHYTGKHSKYDPKTKFGFTDESLDKLIEFFNRFGYQFTREDFKFLDKEDDSFKYKDDTKHLYSDKVGVMDKDKDKIGINQKIDLSLQSNESLSNYTLDN